MMHRSLAGSAMMLALAACEPQYPIAYETEYMRIAKTFDAPICAGTLRVMESDAARIAEQLGGQSYAPVDVVFGVDAVTEHCPPNSTGCAYPGGPVYTEFHSFGHELVHAFVGKRNSLSFMEEGLAEAIGGGKTTIHWLNADTPNVSITKAITEEITGNSAAYTIAGHFIIWLIDRWGLHAFLDLRAALSANATLSTISSSFESVYGVSLEAAELAWQTTAPSRYKVGQGDCDGPSQAWATQQRWSGRLEVDCDAETTFGPLGDSIAVTAGMRRTVVVDVLRGGSHQLSVTATHGGTIEINGYACGCSSGFASSERHRVRAGSQTFEMLLAGCRYRVSYLVEGLEPAAADLELLRIED